MWSFCPFFLHHSLVILSTLLSPLYQVSGAGSAWVLYLPYHTAVYLFPQSLLGRGRGKGRVRLPFLSKPAPHFLLSSAALPAWLAAITSLWADFHYFISRAYFWPLPSQGSVTTGTTSRPTYRWRSSPPPPSRHVRSPPFSLFTVWSCCS